MGSKQAELPTKKFSSIRTWNNWLQKNHEVSTGIWMMIAKKDAGVQTVTYAEALDEALCYGWIDGQKNPYDEKFWLQRFTPRSPKSIWSKKNIEHIDRLKAEGRMKAPGLAAIEAAKANGNWNVAYDAQSTMTIPEDFLKVLKKNKAAADFYKTLNRTNLFSIAFRLQTAKKEETRQKRINTIIEMLSRGEKFH